LKSAKILSVQIQVCIYKDRLQLTSTYLTPMAHHLTMIKALCMQSSVKASTRYS